MKEEGGEWCCDHAQNRSRKAVILGPGNTKAIQEVVQLVSPRSADESVRKVAARDKDGSDSYPEDAVGGDELHDPTHLWNGSSALHSE